MILSPATAYLAAASGILLIFIELIRPGLVLAGTAGMGLLVWGGFGLMRHGLDSVGVTLLSMGVLLGLAETIWNTRSLAVVGALACFAAGSYRLVAGPPQVPALLVAVCGSCFAGAGLFLARAARRGRENKWRDLADRAGTNRFPSA